MTAFTRNQPDSAWIAGYTPGQSDFEDWDRKVAASVNGDDGGTWAPSSPIVITNGVGGAETDILCPVKVCYGARFTTATGGRFAISGPKFEILAPGHAGSTRALLTPMAGAIVEPAAAAARLLLSNAIQLALPRVTVDHAPAPVEIGDLTTVGPLEDVATRTTQILRTHDGATLASITLTWISRQGQPRARLLRCDAGGNPTPITLAAPGADVDGWTSLPAPDAALTIQTSALACDPGVVVDKSQYSYALQIVEDQTLKIPTPLLKRPARLVSTVNLESLHGTPVIDGVQTVAGDIVLLVGQGNTKENGLWYVFGSSNAFTPVGITSSAAGSTPGSVIYFVREGVFPAGYVVPITDGVSLAGSLWQATAKRDYAEVLVVYTTTDGGGTTTTTTAVGKLGELNRTYLEVAQAFAQLQPAGNTYLAAVANHTGITDTRWQ